MADEARTVSPSNSTEQGEDIVPRPLSTSSRKSENNENLTTNSRPVSTSSRKSDDSPRRTQADVLEGSEFTENPENKSQCSDKPDTSDIPTEVDEKRDTRDDTNNEAKSPTIEGASGTKVKVKDAKQDPETEDHVVSFTVTIAQAIHTEDEEKTDQKHSAKKRRHIVEAPKAQNYFHLEYCLYPDSDDAVKTDVVTFGMAAKIYTDKHEPKVLKTWQEGNITWVAWTHCHTVTVTEDLLLKIFDHTLELRIWDMREKMSTRARFDRPKAFKLPSGKSDVEEGAGVKSLVLKQVSSYEKLQPKRAHVKRPLPVKQSTDSAPPLARNASAPRQQQDKVEPKSVKDHSAQDKTLDKTQEKTHDKTHDKTQEKKHDKTHDKTQEKTHDKTHDKTQEKTHDKTQKMQDKMQKKSASGKEEQILTEKKRASAKSRQTQETVPDKLKDYMDQAGHSQISTEAKKSAPLPQNFPVAEEGQTLRSYSRLGKLAGVDAVPQHKDKKPLSRPDSIVDKDTKSSPRGKTQKSPAKTKATTVATDTKEKKLHSSGKSQHAQSRDSRDKRHSSPGKQADTGQTKKREKSPAKQSSQTPTSKPSTQGKSERSANRSRSESRENAQHKPEETQGNDAFVGSFSGLPDNLELTTSLSALSDWDNGDGNKTGKTSAAQGKQQRAKKTAAAKAAVEHAKKHGIACIPISLATLFSGVQTITERLKKPVAGLEDVFLTVSLSGQLMSEEQTKRLNPMVIKVHSATMMPDTPLSYNILQEKCHPAFIKYQFYKQPVHKSVGREQNSDLYWDDISVVLTGLLHPSEFKEYLNGPPLEIELHDRDRQTEKQQLKPALFGDDLEDEKISNVGTISSKRTVHNPFQGREKSWDPYGVAKFDLSGLLLGQTYMHLKAPILNCQTPDVLGIRTPKDNDKLLGVTGAVDGPVDSPLPPGHYLQSSAMLKIKVEIAHPIAIQEQVAESLETPTAAECSFARMVFRFAYKNVVFLHKLLSLITQINAEALDLDNMPAHVIEAALSTYKLSLEQQRRTDLDIVTGFQILDGTQHLFVIEGLGNKAIKYLCESLPRPENTDVDILYNSDMKFRERLYGPLDVDLCRIKMHEPLSIIVQQPLLYVRDMVPKPCFEALVKLDALSKCKKLRDAVKLNWFPTAEMIVSVSREFGVPMTAEDFEELRHDSSPKEKEASSQLENARPDQSDTSLTKSDLVATETKKYENEEKLTDFVQENKVAVKKQSELNQFERSKTMPVMISAETEQAHNYSIQRLNTTEQAKQRLRYVLAQEPNRRFTFCPEFHHSMTVQPDDLEAVRKQQEADSKDAWKSPNGWIYPGKKTMIEANRHSGRPDPARVDQLNQPWEENILHARLRPTLERDRYSWGNRDKDIDVWTRPHTVFGKDDPITIHLAGQKLQEEKRTAQKQEYENWKSRVVVTDPRSYFHRCATDTELLAKGRKSSNQLAKLSGLLKDKPQKYTLKAAGLHLKDSPALGVVNYPSVDTSARAAGLPIKPATEDNLDNNKGFYPGPYTDYSWSLQRNQIPTRDYEHQKFIASNGQDFCVYHKERSHTYKRPVIPLDDDQYDTHLFRLPQNMQVALRKTYLLPSLEEIKQTSIPRLSVDPGLGALSGSSKEPGILAE